MAVRKWPCYPAAVTDGGGGADLRCAYPPLCTVCGAQWGLALCIQDWALCLMQQGYLMLSHTSRSGVAVG